MEDIIKEENKLNNSDLDIMSIEDNSSIAKDDSVSLSSKNLPKITHFNKNLEKIHINDESTYSTNKETKELLDAIQQEQEPQELIINLRQKIEQLEEQVINLRKKNDELKKDNIHYKTKLRKMCFVGNRKNFTLGDKDNTNIKMAEVLKEKNDLQEINENMLNMLTEKELENEELQENFINYKNEMKTEVQKYIDTIDKLEEKISSLEESYQSKENFDKNLDEIIQEYQRYKERMEKSANEHLKKEDELKNEIQKKDNYIQNMKNEMQNLEIENIQLMNQTEQKERLINSEMVDIDKINKENEKLKNEIINLKEKKR